MLAYIEGRLSVEGIPLSVVVADVGTPTYVYGRRELLGRARMFKQAAAGLVCYAIKANNNPHLLRLLSEAGLGADVTSGGELYLARQCGFASHSIIFSGVGKRADEISAALAGGVRAIHLESEMELERVSQIAGEMEITAPIGVRVNPNVAAETHPYQSTGGEAHKFGVPIPVATRMMHRAAADRWLQPVGLAAHIGSQITDLAPFERSAQILVGLARQLHQEGIRVRYIDLGGGLGIKYANERPPAIADWIAAVSAPVTEAGLEAVFEPGRSIVGPGGIFVTRVLYCKQQGGKRFVIVDGGMNDLLRPAMYGAHHAILTATEPSEVSSSYVADVVGPVCETGDFLARDRLLPEVQAGELLAFTHAGAYGFAMSSNYNGRLRPAEVLVTGAEIQVIRQRQRYEDLLGSTGWPGG